MGNLWYVKDLIEKNKTAYPIQQNHFLTLNKMDGKTPSWWIDIDKWELEYCDLRTIFWNEILIDIDEKKWYDVVKTARAIEERLHSYHIPFTAWVTGGKGLHYSIILDAQGAEAKMDWRPIRIKAFEYITAGIKGRIDIRKVYWDDASQGSLVRAEGGSKVRKALNMFEWSHFGGWVKCYKSYVRDIPRVKTDIANPNAVEYPDGVKKWRVPLSLIAKVEDELKRKKEGEAKLPTQPFFGRKIFPCVATMVARMQEGINLQHLERFCVVTQYYRAGSGIADIQRMFKPSPDYNEQKTSYYIHHIIHNEYKPPTCKKIKEWGYCREISCPIGGGKNAGNNGTDNGTDGIDGEQ